PAPWPDTVQKAALTPTHLLLPETLDCLGDVLALAHQQSKTVKVCGRGSKLGWGGETSVDWLLSTERLNRLIDHAVGDLTVTVEAGMPLAVLQQHLQETGQFIPLDPAYPEKATIGGIMATADAGSWRYRYGGVRDLVLGVSLVRADGKLAKAGGRVVKNVAGYDLMKLLTGSYGTLGAIATVTLRTYPIPQDRQTILLTGETAAIAQAAQTLRQSSLTPTRADLLSRQVMHNLDLGEGLGLLVRFESISASTQEQSDTVAKIGETLDLAVTYPTDQEIWSQVQDEIRHPKNETTITCKFGLLPTAAASFLEELERFPSAQLSGQVHINRGLGELYLHSENAVEIISKLRGFCQENSGFLTVLDAPVQLKQQIDPWGYPGNALPMMQQIKQQFDPQNILSPGCFVGGI
ncbi:MAG: FAD-binding oxidoreductase, partial [Kamptonema sp. SIO4C4]|nr:FAD-binding oxidoreductase [Kamptonema sp. SIO4C4]